MENASKALLMAGAVLLGVLLISTMVYMFNSTSSFVKVYETEIEGQSLQAFNSQFEIYNRGKITAQDIISLANMASDNNTKYTVENLPDNEPYIQIICDGKKIEKYSNSEKYQFMEDYSFILDQNGNIQFDSDGNEIIQYYECKKIEYYDNSGRIKKMEFRKML